MEIIKNYNDRILKMRTATTEDIPYLLKWWNDGEIMEHAGFPLGVNITADGVQQSINKNCETRQLLIIELAGIPFGEINFKIDGDKADFGIKICVKTMQNKGIGQVLLNALFEYLFGLGIAKITCDTNPNNTRARHFYEHKMGMKLVKIKENCWVNQIGEPQGAVLFEITREQFKAKKD